MTDFGQRLLDWLLGLDAPELTQLLLNRPDLRRGAEPRSLSELAERLADPRLVRRILDEATLPQRQVAEALVALEGACPLVSLVLLLEPSSESPQEHTELVLQLVDWLMDLGLAHQELVDDTRFIYANPGLMEHFPRPLGLAGPLSRLLKRRSARELKDILRHWGKSEDVLRDEAYAQVFALLSDPEAVQACFNEAPEYARNMLLPIADPQAYPQLDEGAAMFFLERHQLALSWATNAGLVQASVKTTYGEQTYEMPREVALGIRGPMGAASFIATPRYGELRAIDRAAMERETAAAAGDFAAKTLAVLDALAQTSLSFTKAGVVGSRELSRLAKLAGVAEVHTRFVLELSLPLGLIEDNNGVRVSEEFASWRNSPPEQRYLKFLAAWWLGDTAPSAARDSQGKNLPVFGRVQRGSGIRRARVAMVMALAALPPKMGTDREGIIPAALWLRPAIELVHQDEENLYQTHWWEAQALGVQVLGALSDLGRALLDEDPRLEALIANILPTTSESALFGTDLSAIVRGAPSARVSALLDASADREGQGGAVAWRFTAGSIRRALDSGWSAEILLEHLRSITAAGLPETLTYLIEDIGRRHGESIVISAAACIRSDDQALLAQMVADRSLNRLNLLSLSPTVAASSLNEVDTIEALRAAGYLPMPALGPVPPTLPAAANSGEIAGGIGALAPSARGDQIAFEEESNVPKLAAALLAHGVQPAAEPSELERQIAAFAIKLRPAEVRLLAQAIANDGTVVIKFRSSQGKVTTRPITELRYNGSVLHAWCLASQGERSFVLARILAVSVHLD